MMEPVNEHLVESIDRYIEDLVPPPDPALSQNLKDAQAAGSSKTSHALKHSQ